jgi:hypothetical protein
MTTLPLPSTPSVPLKTPHTILVKARSRVSFQLFPVAIDIISTLQVVTVAAVEIAEVLPRNWCVGAESSSPF